MSNKNTPYEQDSGILSTVLGTSLMVGAGYASYYAINDSEGFEKSVGKIFDTVFPMSTPKPNAYQERSLAAHSRLSSVQSIAKKMSKASFDVSRDERLATAEKMGFEYGGLAEVGVNPISNTNFGLGTLRYENKVETIAGNDISKRLVTAINKINPVSSQLDVSFSGTTMNITGAKGGLKLHLTKYVPEIKAFVSRENDSILKAHRGFVSRIGGEIQDPLEELISMLENPMAVLAHNNNARDVMHVSNSVGNLSGKSWAEAQSEINRTVKGLIDDKVLDKSFDTSITLSTRDTQDFLDKLTTEKGEFVTPGELGKMQYKAFQIERSNFDMIMNNQDHFNLGTGNFGRGETTGDQIIKYYKETPGLIEDQIKERLVKAINPNERTLLQSMQGNVSSGLNQEQTNRGIFSSSPHMAMFDQNEQNKGRNRFVRTSKKVASTTSTGMTSPSLWNEETERAVPHLFSKSDPVLDLVGYINPLISDVAILDPRIANKYKGEVSKVYSVNRLNTKKIVDKSSTSVIKVIRENGSTKHFNTVYDYFQEVWNGTELLSDFEKATFNKRLLVGAGRVDDIVADTSSLAKMRKLAEIGNPEYTHSGGFINQRDMASSYESFFHAMKDTAKTRPINISVTGEERVIKWGLDGVKSRFSITKEDSVLFNRNQEMFKPPMIRDMGSVNKSKERIRIAKEKIEKIVASGDTSSGKRKTINALSSYIHKLENLTPEKRSDVAVAWDLFKNVIPGESLGKNSTELPMFYEGLIRGNALHEVGANMKFDKASMEAFSRITNIGTTPVNPNKSVRSFFDEGVHFVQSKKTNIAQAIEDRERLAASMRSAVLNKSNEVRYLSVDEAKARHLEDWKMLNDVQEHGTNSQYFKRIMGEDAVRIAVSGIAHETPSMSQGMGFNTMRLGYREIQSFSETPEILRELGIFNSTETEAVIKHGELIGASLLGKDLGGGIPQFSKETEESVGYLEHIAAERGSISEPGVYLNTMFGNEDLAPNGMRVRVTEQSGEIGERFIPPSAFHRANMVTGEDGKMVVSKFTRSSANLLMDASSTSNYIASKDATSDFDKMFFHEIQDGLKGGFLKRAAMHIEYSSYAENIANATVLNNEHLYKALERGGAVEASETIGNTVFVSKDLYRDTLNAKLSHVNSSLSEGQTLHSAVSELYGADSTIAETLGRHNSNIKNTVNEMTENSLSLSKRMTQALGKHNPADMVAADIKMVSEIMAEVAQNADTGTFIRFPFIYSGSKVSGFMLASDGLEGKTLSGGHTVSKLMKMDFDGDKIFATMIMGKTAREQAVKEMTGKQKLVSQMLIDSENKLARPAGSWASIFNGKRADQTSYENLAQGIKELGEVDTAIAAYATKATTGTMNVKTEGLVSHLLLKAKDKKLTTGEIEQFDAFVGTYYPLKIVQESISAKHIAKKLGYESDLHRVFRSVGELNGSEFNSILKDGEGTLTPMAKFALFNERKSGKSWAVEGWKHYETLNSAQGNLQKVESPDLLAALNHIGIENPQNHVDALVAQREALELAKEDVRPIFDRHEIFKKAGPITLEDEYQAFKSDSRESLNLKAELSRIMKSDKKVTYDDAIKQVVGMMNKYGFKQGSSREIVTGNVGLVSRRSLIGLDATMGFVKEHLLDHPGRMVGLAGAAMVGMAAINTVFGDATPMNPNDSPSVNNPSFRDNRYNTMMDNRQLNNVPNANVSSGLLTDSNNSYDSVMSHLQSNFGNHYSSISVRHDGQDPYKEQMMRYNM